MDIKTIRQEVQRQTIHQLTYSDHDMHKFINREALLMEIQTRLAIAVVDKIMDNLSPAIDKAIKESFSPQPDKV